MTLIPPLRSQLAFAGTGLLAACASSPSTAWHAEALSATAAEVHLAEGAPAPPPSLSPHPPTRSWNERVTLLLGKRTLDDDLFWEPLDEPAAVGLELESLGLGVIDLGIGMHRSRETKEVLGSDFRTSTFEFDIGGRKTWEAGSLRPYLGAGLAFVSTRLEIDDGAYDEMDHVVGYYAHGGAYVLLGEAFTLGVDYRLVSGTDVDLPGFASTDVDYDQVSITLGLVF